MERVTALFIGRFYSGAEVFSLEQQHCRVTAGVQCIFWKEQELHKHSWPGKRRGLRGEQKGCSAAELGAAEAGPGCTSRPRRDRSTDLQLSPSPAAWLTPCSTLGSNRTRRLSFVPKLMKSVIWLLKDVTYLNSYLDNSVQKICKRL